MVIHKKQTGIGITGILGINNSPKKQRINKIRRLHSPAIVTFLSKLRQKGPFFPSKKPKKHVNILCF